MLEPVALSQPRFRIPGLSQDGRGVVVGSQAVLLFYSLDRLVSALRLLSGEPAIGELLPSLRIEEVHNPLGARGYLLRFACTDSRTLDRCAGVAAFCLGTLCVGTERHFVAYRDRRAPLGYDADALSAEASDYVLYTATTTQAYARVGELELKKLLARLQLLPVAGGVELAVRSLQKAGEELWLLVPVELSLRTLRFLFQRGLAASFALSDPLPPPSPPSDFAASRGASPRVPALQLLRIEPRAEAGAKAPFYGPVHLLLALPGVRALRPLNSHIAVEAGYVHPLRLLAFERLFDKEQRHLFLADGRGQALVLTLPATPFVPAAELVELCYAAAPATAMSDAAPPLVPLVRQPAFGSGPPPLRLHLRLVKEPTPQEPPAAVLVPWPQAQLLAKLLSLLPAPLFAELGAVCIDEGILFVGDSGAVASLPLGMLFYAAGPSVFVPFGLALVPRLRGERLTEKLGGGDRYVVFLPGAPPFALARALVTPVSAALLRQLALAERTSTAALSSSPAPTVVNDPLGLLWPLWGK